MPPRLRPLLALPLAAGVAYYLPLPFPGPASREECFHPSLDPHRFTPWTVVAKTAVGDSASIITLRPPIVPKNHAAIYDEGTWSVEAKNERLSVARAYTPFSSLDSSTPINPSPLFPSSPASGTGTSVPDSTTATSTIQDGDLSLFIRATGETSRLVHSTSVGSTVPLRGPGRELLLPFRRDRSEPVRISSLLFIAGGTGVAPALQLAQNMTAASHTEEKTGDLTLLWASRAMDRVGGETSAHLRPETWSWWGREGMPGAAGAPTAVVRYLNDVRACFEQRGGRMDAAFLDSQQLSGRYLRSVVAGLDKRRRRRSSSSAQRIETEGRQDHDLKLLVVSGPPGFVAHYAGPKIYAEGEERQGPLGGVLGEMMKEGRLDGWRVWKL